MRKLFWCCTAAGVMAAGGVFAGARYACHDPKATLAQGVASATTVVPALLHSQLCSDCAAGECETDEAAAAEPQPVAEVEFPAPAGSPAPIVIREDDPAEEQAPCDHAAGQPGSTAALCPAAVVEASEFQGPTPAAFDDEHSPACPTVMPYCTDEQVEQPPAPHMPYAQEKGQTPEQPFSPWLGLGKGTGEGHMPPCQEDSHYYEHYSGCPYVAPRQSEYLPHPAPAVAPPTGRGGDECWDMTAPAPKVHKVKYQAGPCGKEDCPRHPEVDTMEYRKSDGGLNEYGPGPS
jgi:hypothetical protein